MTRTLGSVLLLAFSVTVAQATTVTSNTFPGICHAVVTIGPGVDPAHDFVVYNGALGRGGISLMLFPNQGAKTCYSRNVNPADCASPMQPWVCTPVTDRADDIFDIK
ncbi:MAG: hypothetical protein JOZ05_12210 [Acetobacteraceae bacterium]|nr:hypothetical protein [Acetobacteraceae bacterium]